MAVPIGVLTKTGNRFQVANSRALATMAASGCGSPSSANIAWAASLSCTLASASNGGTAVATPAARQAVRRSGQDRDLLLGGKEHVEISSPERRQGGVQPGEWRASVGRHTVNSPHVTCEPSQCQWVRCEHLDTVSVRRELRRHLAAVKPEPSLSSTRITGSCQPPAQRAPSKREAEFRVGVGTRHSWPAAVGLSPPGRRARLGSDIRWLSGEADRVRPHPLGRLVGPVEAGLDAATPRSLIQTDAILVGWSKKCSIAGASRCSNRSIGRNPSPQARSRTSGSSRTVRSSSEIAAGRRRGRTGPRTGPPSCRACATRRPNSRPGRGGGRCPRR